MSIMSLMSLFEKDFLVVPPCLFFGGRGEGCVGDDGGRTVVERYPSPQPGNSHFEVRP